MAVTPSLASEDASPLSERERRLGVIAAIACVSAFGASAGLSLPFFSVLMERLGWSEALIGLNTATMAVGSLVFGPMTPGWMRRYGLRPVLAIAILVTAIGFGGIFFAGASKAAWFFFRLCIGAGGVVVFIASELWINLNVKPERRGAALGAYATALAGGFASGPIALELTGYEGAAPFIVATAMILAALIPVALVRAPVVEGHEGAAGRMLPLVKRAPAIFSASAVFAATEATIMSLVPVYVIALGLGQAAAGRVVVVYGLGTICTQWLIGRGVDRFGPVPMLIGCASVGLAGALATPFAAATLPSLYALLFFWGGVIVGVYTVGLSLLGDRFTGQLLPPANTGFVMGYNVGALIGPALAGFGMALFGPQGLPATLAALFALYLALIVARRGEETP